MENPETSIPECDDPDQLARQLAAELERAESDGSEPSTTGRNESAPVLVDQPLPRSGSEGHRGEPPLAAAAAEDSPPAAPPRIEQIVEAFLFVGGESLSPARLSRLISNTTAEEIVQAVTELGRRYHRQNRPYEITRRDDGYVLRLRRPYEAVFGHLRSAPRAVRLTQAATDVLAIVAYMQPVSVDQIDAMRGFDSGSIVRQLRRRNLIAPAAAASDKPAERSPRYVTTPRFLKLFNLTSLDDLPRMQFTKPPEPDRVPGK